MKYNEKENIKTFSKLPLRDKRVILDFKKEIKDKIDDVVELKLFGSYARGAQRPDSDIDILVVLNKVNNKKKDMIVDMIRHIIQCRNKYISTHIYSLLEYKWLKKMRTPLMENIKFEAISL